MKKSIWGVLLFAGVTSLNVMAIDKSGETVDSLSHADSLTLTSKTFYYPKRPNQYGQMDYIFIDATNGTQFCQEEGYRNAIGGSILCGEDESSYITFDWYQKNWVAKNTGSKNQCYPLYRSITCQ